FPKHSVLGRMSSNRLVADARNADGLTPVIDRCGGSGSIAGDQREFLDLIVSGSSPDDRPKLEDLGRDASGVMAGILCPPDHLTAVVGSSGKAIISTQCGKSSHLALFPNKPKINKADIVRSRIKSRATPELSQRLRRSSLGNTDDDAPIIFYGPCDIAVWSAERAEIEYRTVSP